MKTTIDFTDRYRTYKSPQVMMTEVSVEYGVCNSDPLSGTSGAAWEEDPEELPW